MDESLTVQAVAEYLKVSRTTVWRYCNQGKRPALKVGKSWRIHRVELERMGGQKLDGLDGIRRYLDIGGLPESLLAPESALAAEDASPLSLPLR